MFWRRCVTRPFWHLHEFGACQGHLAVAKLLLQYGALTKCKDEAATGLSTHGDCGVGLQGVGRFTSDKCMGCEF